MKQTKKWIKKIVENNVERAETHANKKKRHTPGTCYLKQLIKISDILK